MSDAGGSPGEPVLVEEARPLSESMIWRVNDAYYEGSGVAAWGAGDVPYSVSTGPGTALSYVQFIEGVVEDCRAGRIGPVDASSPLYVVELGAGSGRLGFQVLTVLEAARLAPFQVVYVMADRARSNVDFWASNRRLERFAAEGRVDFAHFDPTADRQLALQRSGVVLGPGSLANPMVCIANYLFDAMPQDLFSVLDGELYEELVEVHLDDQAVAESAADYFSHVLLATRRRRFTDGRYGGRLDELVAEAGSRAGAGRRFLFPVAGLAALECVDELAAGRAVWLIGERPPRPLAPVVRVPAGETEPPFRPRDVLRMGVHGRSISFAPDVATLAAAAGGTSPGGAELLLPRDPPPSFLIAAIVVGDDGAASATRDAYRLAVDGLLPDQTLVTVSRAVADRGEGASLPDLVAILRTSRYDPLTLEWLMPAFAERLPAGDWFTVQLAVSAFGEVLRRDYPLVPDADLAGAIASMLVAAGRDDNALWFFERSLEWRAPDAARLAVMAQCHLRLASVQRAAGLANEALALDPSCAHAQAVLSELQTARPR